MHAFQGSCSPWCHSGKSILKPVLVVYLKRLPFRSAQRFITSYPFQFTTAKLPLEVVPKLLCFYETLAELCFHTKCGCKLAAVAALRMSNRGVHGGQGAFDAVQ